MVNKERKTGQSIDMVKAGLLTPALAEMILGLPECGEELSIMDIIEHEPAKLAVLNREGSQLRGRYHFDSGRSADVYAREMAARVVMLLSLGFDLAKVIPIVPDSIAGKNDRYRILSENKIPMFYLMRLLKNPANFISSTEGVVDAVDPGKAGWISVSFVDGEKVMVPIFSKREDIKTGDYLILQETYRREIKTQMLNWWAITSKGKVKGGQSTFRSK